MDAAAQDANIGLALLDIEQRKVFWHSTLEKSPVNYLHNQILPLCASGCLIAIDAPLGWPSELGKALATHQAGRRILLGADRAFLRETDRFVRKEIGISPLSIGADKIARASLRILSFYSELCKEFGCEPTLSWTPTAVTNLSAIEVYPAATAKLILGEKLPPKNDRLAYTNAIFNCATTEGVSAIETEDQNIQDAFLCTIAGLRYISCKATGPTPEQATIAKAEGWIWV